MQKNTSSRVSKIAQRTAIAAVVVAGGVFGISAWAEKQAQTLETPAQAAPVSQASATSNLVPNHGQEGPQPMVTVKANFVDPANDGATSADPIVRGEYLARVGDCVACHTAPGGKPFAGGLAMASPIGTMYSSNITPDTKTGIGSYTFEDFDQAVRHGYAKDKGSLDPAMPFPSYARVSDEDMQDLYAYFMKGVEPVELQVKANDIPWPLSMRWPLTIWRSMFAPDGQRPASRR